MQKARLREHLTRVRKESGYECKGMQEAISTEDHEHRSEPGSAAAGRGLDCQRRYLRSFAVSWQCQMDGRRLGPFGYLLGLE